MQENVGKGIKRLTNNLSTSENVDLKSAGISIHMDIVQGVCHNILHIVVESAR